MTFQLFPTTGKRPEHRYIRERWVIEGTLELTSATHFGSGSADEITDMPVFLDEATQRPLLPGSSIAGALRNYLREFEVGYGAEFSTDEKEMEKERRRLNALLFGTPRGDDAGRQSVLTVFDALGKAAGYEIRDGVSIDGSTRTASEYQKYDIQLLSAGSTFDLRFELSLGMPIAIDEASANQAYEAERRKVLMALASALSGLQNGEIALGGRKRRGYGRCQVN